MGLDISLIRLEPTSIFSANITHNLAGMACEAEIFKHIWEPEEVPIKYAFELIEPLKKAIELMEEDPERFKKFNASNGWGTYPDFLAFLKKYYEACKENPTGEVHVSR